LPEFSPRTPLKSPSAKPLRVVAAKILERVISGQSLTRQLELHSGDVAPNEKAILAEIVYGSCRWYHRLDAVLAALMKKPLRARDLDIHSLLIAGLYQLQFMRIKPHAVVAETVNAVRQLKKPALAGLVNGVLRSFQRDGERLLTELDKDPVNQYSMPAWLSGKLKKHWPDHWQTVAGALLEAPPMVLRVNRLVSDAEHYQQVLQESGMTCHLLEGIPSALVLEQPVTVDRLPGFAAGEVSVQDGGAQLAALLLDIRDGEEVLDACAAPGGKTGHLLEQGRISLTAMDEDEARLQRVRQNLERLKLDARVLVGDAADTTSAWADRLYDAILLDVPCSATGVIRRHPDIKLLRQPEDIGQLAHLQQRILENAWASLKPGGRLLYVTCSLMPEENDVQVANFIKKHNNARVMKINPGVEHVTCNHGIQLLPGLAQTDGFYYALLGRADES
jgi:16S rRNA (cytosine967-C5)-methyltransferase